MNLPVLGAWLHDIGKFAQRAQQKFSPLEHEYCPSYEGRSTHQHVLYTDYFIENVLPLPSELKADRSKIAALASSHHRADGKSREHQAIKWADQLSSGMDRTESGEEGNFRKERLDSVFYKVRLGGKGMVEGANIPKYRLIPLGEEDALFPVDSSESGHNYQTLWREFEEQLKSIPCNLGVNAWQASLISLLERYCWCIPSSTWKTLPDISLYDHSATTAAITQALLACPQGQEKFLLFGGDLSGIQAFIFGREEPADKGAFRLLRARSFILQAMTRSVWLVLLERLGLEQAAKIMDAGRRFILLLPDTPKARQELDKLEAETEAWLLKSFQGSVRLNFGRLPLEPKDLQRENFISKFEEFNEALENAKLTPFSRACKNGLLPVLPASFSDYNQNGECAFCHTRPGDKEEDGQSICLQCRNLKQLGAVLPKSDFIVFTRGQADGIAGFKNLLFDGLNLYFYEKMPDEHVCRHALNILSVKREPVFTAIPLAGHTPLVTKEDLRRWEDQGKLTKKDGESLFMGEPCKAGEQKTFAMLAEEARVPPARPGESWHSIACLGVCKADVDNLGLIFSMGFCDSFTISCYAMLARMLNHFFAGYFMELIKRDYPNIYVVFAGGDDVFVIGPWSEAIDFGMAMATEFGKFCGGNPAVSISAGIPLVKPGLPMRAIREEAEARLKESKNFSDKGGKNAVTIFGVSAHWDEAAMLLDTGHWLAGLCDQGVISRAFLRRLLGYSRECREFLKGKKLAKNGLYISHLEYDLARNWETMDRSNREKAERENDLLRIKKLAQDKNQFPKSEMGISWAIYRTRISA